MLEFKLSMHDRFEHKMCINNISSTIQLYCVKI